MRIGVGTRLSDSFRPDDHGLGRLEVERLDLALVLTLVLSGELMINADGRHRSTDLTGDR
jgi:hypothetical protein